VARQLSIGLVGEDVKLVQNTLNTIAQFNQLKFNTNNPLLIVDGIFGAKTKGRVVEFQSRHAIVGDGIVGPVTMNLINIAMDIIKKLPPPPAPRSVYNRMFAIQYAGIFFNRVTSDARVATKAGYPRAINGVTLTPGLFFSQVGFVNAEEDCTHFVSCCIGRPPPMTIAGIKITAGNLPLQTAPHVKAAGAYGRDTVPEMVPHLVANRLATIVGAQFQARDMQTTEDNIKNHLRPGDLIAYASKDTPGKYEHLTLLVSEFGIACHTRSRFNERFDTIGFPWVTLLKLPA
jgi:hypothetical protein